MARGPLISLLEDIRRLYEDGAVGLQSDAQLLERFRSLGDRSAFEALVGRHGRMILSICREVLGDPDDAEDAFQATFLLLARKAGALRVDRTLAGWLHRVGYRVAVQAGLAAGRRRCHEERAAALVAHDCERPADVAAEAAERRRVLHAELDRLPDRLRVPIVLYYLEGRSYAEAASPLGVPEATVRGRLARARDRLRDRLTRRGIAPAEASGLFLPPIAAATAPVPPGLVSLTARAAACLMLAPTAPAGGTAASIALMRPVIGATIASKLKAVAAGIAAALALAWMTASLAAPTGQGEPPPRANAQASGRTPSETKPSAGTVVRYAGRILGPDDRPIKGAEIFLHYTRPNSRLFGLRARTDAAGRFRFEVDPARLVKGSSLKNAYLYARAEGYGPVSIPVGFPPQEAPGPPRQPLDQMVFRLPRDDVGIEGRILDDLGRPAKGASIWPLALYYKQDADGEPLDWSDPGSMRSLENQLGDHNPLALIDSVSTDADGRFRLTGLGRERAVVLQINHPGYMTERVEVITRPGRSPAPVIDEESSLDGRPIVRYDAAALVHLLLDNERPRIRTVFLSIRPGRDRVESLRVTEWLTKELSQWTKLKVVGDPRKADIILQGTINRRRDGPANPPAGPPP